MKTLAVIDSNGLIINRIVIEDGSDWTPPENCTILEEIDQCYEIGATYLNGVYTPLPQPPEPQPPPELTPAEKLQAVGLTVADLKLLMGIA